MRTTMDLPDDLMRAIKMRALQEGKKLNEIMPELLANGLKTDRVKLTKARLGVDEKTGLLVILGGKTPKREMTPTELSDILNEQEASYHIPPR